MNQTYNKTVVPEAYSGKRLDQALALLLPESGLRERKRLWECARINVDGRPRPKGYRVQTGQQLEIIMQDQSDREPDAVPHGVRVVGQKSDYMAAIFKPGRVHSEPIAGKPGLSVGQALPMLWPGRDAVLVNRLDYLTSGLLVAALDKSVAAQYRNYENEGVVEKVYLAVVKGRVDEPFTITNIIDAADRKKVRVGDEQGDPLRHSSVRPLKDVGGDCTLVAVAIQRGTRHQIRAHLAFAGFPILGDPLYGTAGGDEIMYLHHYKVSLPDFEAKAEPTWPEWSEWKGGGVDCITC